jgi:hypothetical protein
MKASEVRISGFLEAEALAYIEAHPHPVLWLGSYNSDWVDADEEQVKENTNRLIAWLGGEDYQPEVVQVCIDGVEVETDSEATNLTLGERLFGLAVGAAIDHEDPEVTAGVNASLRVGVSGLMVVLRGEGSSWTDEYFTHRTSGEVVSEDMLEPGEKEAMYDNEEYDADSTPQFSLRFEAIIDKP